MDAGSVTNENDIARSIIFDDILDCLTRYKATISSSDICTESFGLQASIILGID